MSKYNRLTQYLSIRANEECSGLKMSFSEIGDLIPGGLPKSALNYSAWWNSSGHSHAQQWERSGFKASPDFTTKTVRWVKMGNPPFDSQSNQAVDSADTSIQSVDQDWVGPDLQDSLYLVACVKGKLDGTHPAKDLYNSDFFRKARAYVESRRSPWFILSAKYLLISPEEKISTYNETLKDMSKEENRAWAREILKNAPHILPNARRIVFLAGKDYRGNLVQGLSDLGYTIAVPMAGLGIGKQLSWLQRHTQ